jgi:uncharacterized protein YnzC (UPF0291/DUF896 family)
MKAAIRPVDPPGCNRNIAFAQHGLPAQRIQGVWFGVGRKALLLHKYRAPHAQRVFKRSARLNPFAGYHAFNSSLDILCLATTGGLPPVAEFYLNMNDCKGGRVVEHEQIARINELARKSRILGLSEAEAEEQKRLRAQYLREFRANMEQTLQSVRVEQEDGSYLPLEKRTANSEQ